MAYDERDHDLTPAERAAWAALPDERPVPPALEEHVVRQLRRAGRLGRGRRGWLRPLGLAAAAGLIFAAGLGMGLALDRPTQVTTSDDPAFQVQRAGSEYVQALTQLGAGPGAAADPAGQVALTTFYGAARELSRIAGPEALAQHFIAVAGTRADSAPGDPVIWF